VSGQSSRRRLRVRRKRKGESPSANAAEAGGEEVILETGCCLVEAVAGASMLAALLTVPAYLLMR
jgi:hypothetical protein